jgi:uncharacterized phage protein (TIGR01671 family)
MKIKFRGLSENSNNWVYGYYYKISTRKEMGCITFDSNKTGDWEHEIVFDNTVGQFTGFKDKNSIEIYEGDILSLKWKAEVYKDENTGAYMVKFHTNSKIYRTETLYIYLKSRIKAQTDEIDNIIIGNIYQNKNLLKS